MAMTTRAIALACALVLLAASPGHARSIGQVIDDAAIVASVTARITAERLSNLFRIDVKSNEGVVTLSGTVDTPERRDRLVQLASWANGVKSVVNNIQVSGAPTSPPTATTPPPSPARPSGGARVDATGSVVSVEPSTGRLGLADGRVLRATDETMIWQSSTLQALRPGTRVMIRDGSPVGLEGRAARTGDWRMGTVSRLDRAAGWLILTDGTTVRVSPSTIVQRGSERLTLDALQPGSEIVVTPSASASEASQIDIVWAPTASTR
jgi:hyperosmotically inducible protein